MIDRAIIEKYRNLAEEDLLKNTLPFWMKYIIDKENGGFYGWLSNSCVPAKYAFKAIVPHSRFLWNYSTAYRVFKDEKYLQMAKYAYDYIMKYFWDYENGGVYWTVDYKGKPLRANKKIYGQAFCIYGLSEYYRATGEKESLDRAIELFRYVQKYSYDPVHKGYFDACYRDWSTVEDPLSEDWNISEKKSMNNILHVMEAFTNLMRVWDDPELKKAQKELIDVTIEHIIDPVTYHFKTYFDEKWNSLIDEVSYGHDIEGSWLLSEAAEVLGDEETIKKADDIAVKMVDATLSAGVDEDGGVYWCGNAKGVENYNKHWWPQAEAAVGYLNAYTVTGNSLYMDQFFRSWDFINNNMIDKVNGEWFMRISRTHVPDTKSPKGSDWKSPYHNTRACFEVMERLEKLIHQNNQGGTE